MYLTFLHCVCQKCLNLLNDKLVTSGTLKSRDILESVILAEANGYADQVNVIRLRCYI